MSDPFRKVRSGDALKIPYLAYNDFIDGALERKRRQQGRIGGPGANAFDATIVSVKNASGGDLPRFSVVGISGPIISPEDNADTFAAVVALTGVTPATSHAGKFAVLLEPVASGNVGRAVVSGVVPCYLDVSDASDGFADVDNAVSLNLKTGSTGAAKILWVDSVAADPQPSGAGATLYWGVVRIGAGGGLPAGTGRYKVLMLLDDNDPGTPGYDYERFD